MSGERAGARSLVVVRGWSTGDEGRFPEVIAALADATEAIDVVSLYRPPDGASRMDDWAGLLVDELLERLGPDDGVRPLLLGYCLGGHLILEVAAALIRRGRPPAYVGLIDTWLRTPSSRMRHGVYRRFGVSWREQLRDQVRSLVDANPVPPRRVVADWVHVELILDDLRAGPDGLDPVDGSSLLAAPS